MSHRNKALVAIVAGTALLISSGAAIGQAAIADERSGKAMQTLNVDFATETGNFRGGASGTLYGLGDDGSPADAILDGAQVENSSQKPPSGTQHPSGDALALENQFFSNGGNELAVYMQDYYPDWSYNSGNRPSDSRTYVLDVPVDDLSYGTYTNGGDGVWDYEQVTEIVINKVLANTEHPDQYTFIPFNEPDGGNWYASGDNASAKIFRTFLSDWDSEYKLIQKIWQQYKNGEKPSKVKPTADHARVAGPGDCVYRQNRSSAFLSHAKSQNTLPDVFVWHELGKESLSSFRSHYESYRKLEKKYGINPIDVNITEYGELRDMSVPGQLIQWQSMFEDEKVQAETAYWNYAGNLSDNMARANSANAGWWQFKWYGDLRGAQTVKVSSDYMNKADSLQGIAAIDRTNKKATVLYGGANDANADQVKNDGSNIPVTVHLTGLDQNLFGSTVDVEVRENAFTGPDGVAATPRVVNALSDVDISSGTLDVTTTSVDRYASYQLIVTPHQDRVLSIDNAAAGRALLVEEVENTVLSGGAQTYIKTPWGDGWNYFMTSGNGDVGSFKTGSIASWTVDVPADGIYRFQVISGNTGFPGDNDVSVDGQSAGTIHFGAELAMKPAAKWLYRGSGEVLLRLKQGQHQIQLHGSSMDNTLDKFLLYQVSASDNSLDRIEYPADQFRLESGALLTYDQDGARGFASLNGGEAKLFAHAWESGYHSVKVVYTASRGDSMVLSVNGTSVTTITAESDGLQSSMVNVALSEGINKLELSGDAVSIRDITTCRDAADDSNAITLEAESLQLAGGAQTRENSASNASGYSYVTGLGKQFVTEESGAFGMGDQTRVVTLDTNNTPKIADAVRGTVTIPAGTIPAGKFNMVVRFSNDAFIGKHDYNPQIVDLGLQVRDGTANGEEVARGAFRYTYSDSNFLERAMTVETSGSALVLGNWDEPGVGAGAVSWGVGPNLDYVQFYPVMVGDVYHQSLA